MGFLCRRSKEGGKWGRITLRPERGGGLSKVKISPFSYLERGPYMEELALGSVSERPEKTEHKAPRRGQQKKVVRGRKSKRQKRHHNPNHPNQKRKKKRTPSPPTKHKRRDSPVPSSRFPLPNRLWSTTLLLRRKPPPLHLPMTHRGDKDTEDMA